jgi:hypothetical protein
VTEVAGRPVTAMNVRVIYRGTGSSRGGDQIPFLERGYPAARFTEPNEKLRAQHQDVRSRTASSTATCRSSATSTTSRAVRQGERRDAVVPGAGAGHAHRRTGAHDELTNDTELVWAANRRRNMAGYEVVWRPTVEDDWTG